MIKEYNHKKIEKKVQKYWKKNKFFKVYEDKKKEKYYCLSMFPYPSGNLHMGHIRNYTISDIIARYNRMLNKNVLHPIGWDSFGLPAEEAAIKNNIEPYKWTLKNIKKMKKQLKSMGFSYDWSREISTCNPDFYKWEQYIFIKLYKKKIVYKKKSLVNWCKQDKTVLANEQVIKKRCWRCNNKVKMKKMYQWFIKTKKYAKRLLKDMKYLKKWPKKVISMQKKWIGYKKQTKILINITNNNKIFAYTSRIDTICGVTFILLFYKSKFIKKNIEKNIYIKKIFKKCKKKKNKNILKAYKTNFHAINPITKKKIPIWISNYFLDENFKKKSILACPGHNKSEWLFAKKYKIKIKFVIKNITKDKNKINEKPILYKGILFNSHKKINGLHSEKVKKIIKKKLNKITKIRSKSIFKIKDWNISRQRYWGCPIPSYTLKNKKIYCVSKKELPIVLKNTRKKYNKTRKILVKGKLGTLEKDTFDTFIESSWYYIRYTSPKYKKGIVNPKSSKYWLPVDFYIGGIEHATMHLMYFRIYCKILKDLKIIKFDEPVKNLICQGMVLSDTFYKFSNKKKIWVSKDEIKIIKNKKGKIKKIINKVDNSKINYLGMTKMSKSKNNGIEPKKIIKKYGADSLRLFITFSAPIEESMEWKDEGINGSYKFIKKIWKLSNIILKKKTNKKLKIYHNNLNKEQKKIRSEVHRTIVKISENMKKKKCFHTSISRIMKIVKKIEKFNNNKNSLIIIESFLIILKLLNPFIPHIIFYIFKKFDILYKLNKKCWPVPDKKAIIENFCKIIIQINGKKRYIINTKKDIKEKEILKIVIKKNNLKKYIKNNNIKKTIFIKNKIINILTK
ncbi:leucine--tRNA ligase [Buchnera aphidicola (Ceratovacuna keduensis)]|uniref:leucine--tRNA ligase n=1 Tax=Buchnera aphidicola TaxID=9 RepID=UPI0031B89110